MRRYRSVMPVFAGLFLILASTTDLRPVNAQTAVPSESVTYYRCPDCGRLHTRAPGTVSKSASTEAQPETAKSSPKAEAKPADVVTSFKPSVEVNKQPVREAIAAPVKAAVSTSKSLAENVLGLLNQQRSRQGLRTLRYDATLQAVAERRAQTMARMGLKGHPPGSFAPGRYEGVGWNSSYSPRGVNACYTSDPRMSAAGAAMVRGRDGVYFAVVYR